jgi:hypothetical protein
VPLDCDVSRVMCFPEFPNTDPWKNFSILHICPYVMKNAIERMAKK